jgi:ADP-ribosyl-[dinitrogen reductase] hydrolase
MIAEVRARPEHGLIGITLCPGKQQHSAMSGSWARDLAMDLDRIRQWGVAAVVSLIEDHEMAELGAADLGPAVRARHMAWYHLPIRDVSVPDQAFEAAWQRAGPQLRFLLGQGFGVLIHCKGGLGRAGTLAARLMVELGVAPEAAMAEVRAARPGAIETQAQAQHVRTRQVVTEAAPDTGPAAVRDRALGALLGLAVGDALGTTLEFRARDTYPLLTDMVGGGPFRLKAGEWTDDTAMALALADVLAGAADLDERLLMERFTDWAENGAYSCNGRCFDIGLTVRAALARFQRSGNPVAGSSDPQSAGNGSLMRLAPVAIRYWPDRVRLRQVAARQSRTTHGAAEAVDACVAFAELLADAIAGKRAAKVLAARETAYAGQIAAILAGSWRGKRREDIRASGYVAHSLEAALWSVGRSGTFAEAVLMAANLGEDADTTAAIAGQLAGALYGMSAIPADWRRKLAWHDKIVAMAEALLPAQAAVAG